MCIRDRFECSEKLVTQAYDGAATMPGNLNGVQTIIKSTNPQALFAHCYAFVLNLVMSQNVSQIYKCKVFFSILSAIATFFVEISEMHGIFRRVCAAVTSQSASNVVELFL